MKRIKEIGGRLKEIRLIFNFTQNQIAKEMNVTQATVVRLESGKCSASALLQALDFYSQFINLDVLLDDKAWSCAFQDKEVLLTKKVHINSIVNMKIGIMKEKVLNDMEYHKKEILDNFDKMETYINRGFDSVSKLTDDK